MLIRQIPNLVTIFNLLSGCLSVIFVFSGDILLASWMIALAAVFDFLDGFLARLLRAGSEIGKMLDSLADMVSFGIAPGMIMFRLMEVSVEAPDLVSYAALLIPAFSAIRLAIFSVDKRQAERFIGVPTPMTALLIASIPLILSQYDDAPAVFDFFSNPWILLTITVITSLMLVSPWEMMALKFKTFDFKENRSRYLFALASLALIVSLGYLALPVIYLLYIASSLVESRGR